MVHQWVFFLVIFILSGLASAQDERYFRQILTGELPRINEVAKEVASTQFSVNGPLYRVDLNDDGVEEIIQPQKRDGVDWIEIKNSSLTTLFEARLLAMGAESSIYKIRVVDLSQKVRALVLYVDEGTTKGLRFESTARLFVISFENKNLSKMWIEQGPHFFHEKEGQRDQYWRRNYSVNVFDMDGDGVKEISVQYNHTQRIMKYNGSGNWSRF
jgi:hypothetical protein